MSDSRDSTPSPQPVKVSEASCPVPVTEHVTVFCDLKHGRLGSLSRYISDVLQHIDIVDKCIRLHDFVDIC